jgi:hypothetical protein
LDVLRKKLDEDLAVAASAGVKRPKDGLEEDGLQASGCAVISVRFGESEHC